MGYDENLLVRTQIQRLRMPSPLVGVPGSTSCLSHPLCRFVPLFALGSADPTSGFCLGNLSLGMPTTIVGSILDMVVISCDVKGTMCGKSGRCVSVYNTIYDILQGSVASPPRL
jgi:hypothetical protein